MSFVSIENVSLQFGGADGIMALKDASLQIEAGEFIAVVGPSGCGKSTLMKIMSGLWPTTAGQVVVAGKPVTAPISIVGMAFQNPNLLPWRTTLDNVLLPLQIVESHRKQFRHKQEQYRDQARQLLAQVGLAGFESHFPWQLSGGMQQRVSLCRALIHEPVLLMLDEPFGALDMFTKEELWGVLQDVWMVRKPTVILVTHDLREAVFLADKVFVMSARPGRVIAEHVIDLPRPRTLEGSFDPAFIAYMHQLRENISDARKVHGTATPEQQD